MKNISTEHLRRLNAGRKKALRSGVRFGRPPKLTDKQLRGVRKMLCNGHSMSDIAEKYGVSHATISRINTSVLKYTAKALD